MPRIQILFLAPTLLMMLTAALPSYAQNLSVNLTASAVNFNLTAGSASNPGSTSITATTRCPGCFFRTVNVYAYFSDATAALSQAGSNIPSSAFQISNNGGPFQALTNNTPFGGAGAGTQLSSFFILFGGFGFSHDDVMNFNINLSALPNLAPGTYTGTLTIRAQAP